MNYKKPAKKRYILLVLVAMLFIGVAAVVFVQINGDNQGYRTISVIEVSGKVSVVKNGIEYEAYPGMLLQEGYEIATSGNSYVRLVLDDDKYIKIESGSRAVFETLGLLGSGKTKIVLERGAMTNELINPLGPDEEYVVNTPNAVLAVRGTFFRVDLSITKEGDVRADVKTYGGQVASQRVKPTGEVIEEEVLINAGYQTTINMTPIETHYVVETDAGESIIVEPEDSGGVSDSEDRVAPTRPIMLEEISDDDLVDVYFARENGHELFVTTEEAKDHIEKREIKLEEKTSVYEKAEEVKAQKEAEEAGESATTVNTTNAKILANDSQPLAMVEVPDEDTETKVAKEEKPQGSRVLTDGDGDKKTTEPSLGEESLITGLPESDETTETVASNNTQGATSSVDNNLALGPFGNLYVPVTPPVVGEESTEPHVHTEVTTTTNATCSAEGKTVVSCSECGEVLSETTIAKLEHTLTVSYTEGTATTEGSLREHCRLCDETISVVQIMSIPLHFPDEVFAQYVRDNFDTDNYKNALSEEELSAMASVTKVDVSGTETEDGGIASLEGIEYFKGLTWLACDYNQGLTRVDLSNNPKVNCVELSSCDKIEEIDVSGAVNLQTLPISVAGNLRKLYAADTGLTDLNLTMHAFLEELDVTNVPLVSLQVNSELIKEIDVTTNTELQTLDVSGCQALETLDLTKSIQLRSLKATNTLLTEIDCSSSGLLSELLLIDNPQLQTLNLINTSITSLDLSRNPKIQNLNVAGTQLTSLDTATLHELQELNVSNTNISELMLMNNTALRTLYVFNAGVSILDVGSPYISELDISSLSGLTELNLSNCTALKNLDVSQNRELVSFAAGGLAVEQLDFTANTKLKTLRAMNSSSLETVYLDNCTMLEEANFYGSAISSLTLKDKTSLMNVSVQGCQNLASLTLENILISSIDLSTNTGLTNLTIWDTDITELDLSQNSYPSVVSVDVGRSMITNINVSGCNNISTLTAADTLQRLNISGCKNISELPLQNYTGLIELNCSGSGIEDLTLIQNNNLISLNASNCTSLRNVEITDNDNPGMHSIGIINVAGCTGLESLGFSNCTNINSIDISQCPNLKYLFASGSGLTSLNVTANANLMEVDVSKTPLTELSFASTTGSRLTSLDVSLGSMTDLNVKGCASLSNLTLNGSLTDLNVVDCTSLTTLDFSPCSTTLQTISMTNSGLSSSTTDLSVCTALRELYMSNCSNMTWTNLTIGTGGILPALEKLETSNLVANTLEINSSVLNILDMRDSSVDLVFTDVSNLGQLSLEGCSMSVIELSNAPVLGGVSIKEMENLSRVVLENNTNLNNVSIWGCQQLDEVSLTGAQALFGLTINNATFTSLDLSNLSSLQSLNLEYCENMTSLDLTGCTSIIQASLFNTSGNVINITATDTPNITSDLFPGSNVNITN